MISPAKSAGSFDLSWLSEVNEVGPPLRPPAPIALRQFLIRSGPALPHPESHPYCELSLHTSGCGIEYVERGRIVRKAGDVFIAGPGVPHYFTITRYPLRGIAIYFLPSLLCETASCSDGLYLLDRFTAKQDPDSRVCRPSLALRRQLAAGFRAIQGEFTEKPLGYEIRVRSLLMNMLVDLMRWERRTGKAPIPSDAALVWDPVNKALRYLREHFAEPVYAREVAEAAGVSLTRLKVIFRETLGMPWSQYLQNYRLGRAVTLLCLSECNVTQTALAVGFESLSHFNAAFRSFTGLTPSAYLKHRAKTAKPESKTGSGSSPVILK